jgi:hypothetical protein
MVSEGNVFKIAGVRASDSVTLGIDVRVEHEEQRTGRTGSYTKKVI